MYTVDYPIPPAVGQYPQPIILKVPETVGSPRDHLHLVAETFGDAIGFAEALPGLAVKDGQHKRGAARLALIELAGELATEYGLTGWQEGEAVAAAQDALRRWKQLRGSGPSEHRQVLTQVLDFIERHGDGRFSRAGGDDTRTVQNRAGWWRDTGRGDDSQRVYLFNSSRMKEALLGFDFKRAVEILVAAGALTDGKGGKSSRK